MTEKELYQKAFSHVHASPELIQEVIDMENGNRRRHKTIRSTIRRGTLIAIAATLVMLLGVTAYAVYQYSLRDAVTEIPTSDAYMTAEADENGETVVETTQALSLNGFTDSPECQAWQEWETYLAQWQAENSDWFAERGVDDSYYETSASYASIYGAYAAETGEKLDEILAKYGLTAHTSMQGFATHGQLCRALGVDAVIDGYDVLGTYLYDDGSFKMEGTTLIDGETAWFEMFVAVKGSFSRISGAVPEGEEWTYTTQSGTPVIMALNEEYDRINIIAGLDGCYVTGYIETTDQTQAEEFADSIQWETLNDCFATAEAREETAASVAAYMAEPDLTIEDVDDGAAVVMEILGTYTPTAEVPESFYLYSTRYELPHDVNESSVYGVTLYYDGMPTGVTISYRTLKDGETEPEGAAGDELTATTETACTVNGYDAILVTGNADMEENGRIYSLRWLDTDRDLMFTVGAEGSLGLERLTAIAESLTADDPTLEANAEAYAERAEQLSAEITALEEADWEEMRQVQAEYNAQVQAALDAVGDYDVTADGYDCLSVTGSEVQECWDWFTDEDWGYCYQTVGKNYENSEGTHLWLSYDRYWDTDGNSELPSERLLATARKFSEMDDSMMEYTFDLSVGGHEAYSVKDGDILTIVWYDEDSGLAFSLQNSYGSLSAEELIAIAETVQPAA